MLRIIAVLVALVLASFALIFLFARLNVSQVKDQVVNAFPVTSSRPVPDFPETAADTPLTKAEFLQILEASISAVNAKISSSAKTSPVTPISNQTQPQTQSTTTTTTSTGPKTLYIPIGYGGSGSNSNDFGTVSGQEVSINTADYPGYKQAVFEANFRIFQGNGTGYVRLFNKTDGTAILNSEVSTTSQDYVQKSSSNFPLASGNKTYTVQVKSTTGYSVDLQLTRVRIDF